MKKKIEVLKVVECEGAMCVSIDDNSNRYYAKGVSSRVLKFKKYKYEKGW